MVLGSVHFSRPPGALNGGGPYKLQVLPNAEIDIRNEFLVPENPIYDGFIRNY